MQAPVPVETGCRILAFAVQFRVAGPGVPLQTLRDPGWNGALPVPVFRRVVPSLIFPSPETSLRAPRPRRPPTALSPVFTGLREKFTGLRPVPAATGGSCAPRLGAAAVLPVRESL